MEGEAMITEFKLYTVQCDLCEEGYPDTEQYPRIYFPSEKEAVKAIVEIGWVVMHNIPAGYPRILCPTCNAKAEASLPIVDQIKEHFHVIKKG